MPDENPSGLGTFTCNLRLPGPYFDKETNTHYNYFRDYDPSVGRYLQSDLIGLAGGVNTYAYIWSNPLRWHDQFGLQVGVPAGTGAGAGTSGAGAAGGAWWGSRQKPRDPGGFSEDLFPEAGKKPSISWPNWLRWPNWIKSESAEEEKKCPVPVPSDPAQPPAPGWEWRGKGEPGSKDGAWYNPSTGESMHPDRGHAPPIGPHWDYIDPRGNQWRVDPATGNMRPK